MSQGKGDTVRPSCVDGATWDENWTRTFGQPTPGGDPFTGTQWMARREAFNDAFNDACDARARLQRAKDADAAFLRRLTGGG